MGWVHGGRACCGAGACGARITAPAGMQVYGGGAQRRGRGALPAPPPLGHVHIPAHPPLPGTPFCPGACTAVSIGGGVALALASLWLFKRSPAGMVSASCALQVRRAARAARTPWSSERAPCSAAERSPADAPPRSRIACRLPRATSAAAAAERTRSAQIPSPALATPTRPPTQRPHALPGRHPRGHRHRGAAERQPRRRRALCPGVGPARVHAVPVPRAARARRAPAGGQPQGAGGPARHRARRHWGAGAGCVPARRRAAGAGALPFARWAGTGLLLAARAIRG